MKNTDKPKKLTKAEVARVDDMLLHWYSTGWSVSPERVTPSDVARLLCRLAAVAHVCWTHCMRTSRAPGEDVSPAEGLVLAAALVKHVGKGKRGVPAKDLMRTVKSLGKCLGSACDAVREALDDAVPGYSDGAVA